MLITFRHPIPRLISDNWEEQDRPSGGAYIVYWWPLRLTVLHIHSLTVCIHTWTVSFNEWYNPGMNAYSQAEWFISWLYAVFSSLDCICCIFICWICVVPYTHTLTEHFCSEFWYKISYQYIVTCPWIHS